MSLTIWHVCLNLILFTFSTDCWIILHNRPADCSWSKTNRDLKIKSDFHCNTCVWSWCCWVVKGSNLLQHFSKFLLSNGWFSDSSLASLHILYLPSWIRILNWIPEQSWSMKGVKYPLLAVREGFRKNTQIPTPPLLWRPFFLLSKFFCFYFLSF